MPLSNLELSKVVEEISATKLFPDLHSIHGLDEQLCWILIGICLTCYRWKEARKTHTLNHTANKLKTLFKYIEEVKDDMVNYIKKNIGRKFEVRNSYTECSVQYIIYNRYSMAIGIDENFQLIRSYL